MSNYKTKQKELILQKIESFNRDFTINDLNEITLGEVGLTTIYRYIEELINDDKLIKVVGDNNNSTFRYLTSCCTSNYHYYLKCTKCGRVEHVDCDCAKNMVTHIGATHDFLINNFNITIEGICSRCNSYE